MTSHELGRALLSGEDRKAVLCSGRPGSVEEPIKSCRLVHAGDASRIIIEGDDRVTPDDCDFFYLMDENGQAEDDEISDFDSAVIEAKDQNKSKIIGTIDNSDSYYVFDLDGNEIEQGKP